MGCGGKLRETISRWGKAIDAPPPALGPGGGFAGGPLTDDVAALGLIAVDLAAAFPQWVRRRKRTYEFYDESTVKIRMSVDLVLPDREWFLDHAPEPGQTIYIPIDIPRKEPLAGFSITDAEDRAISVLNTEENGRLTTEGFSALVDTARAQPPHTFRGPIQNIVMAPTGDAGAVAYTAAMNQGMRNLLPPGSQWEALLQDLQGGFLLMVPIVYQPDANHIFKLSWTSSFTWRKPGLGGALRAAAASLGLVDKTLNFEELAGFAHGTHFEFHTPEYVRNLQTKLATTQYDAAAGGPVSLPERCVVHAKPVANVNTSVRSKVDVLSARSDEATVSLRLRSRRGGPFMATWIVAWMTAVLIGVIAARLSDLDAQSSSAVILLLPAVLAAYLAREGEHAIASRLLAGIRVGGLGISAIAFAAAAIIGVGDLRDPLPARAQPLDCVTTPPAKRTRGTAPKPSRTECRVPAAPQRRWEANSDLQLVIWGLAGACGLIALLITAGLWRTHRATRRAHAASDFAITDP